MRTFLTIFILLISVNIYGQKKFNVIIESVVYDKPVTREEFRIQDSLMTRMLVGKWKDQNSLIEYLRNGRFITKFDEGFIQKGDWKINHGFLVFTMDRIVTNLPDGRQVPYQESYQILLLTRDEFHSVTSVDTTIWKAKRIK